MNFKKFSLPLLAGLSLAGCAAQVPHTGYTNPLLGTGQPVPPPPGTTWPAYWEHGGENGGSGGRD